MAKQPKKSAAQKTAANKRASEKAAAQKRTAKQSAVARTDWGAVLRSGPAGVKKFNKLTREQREAVTLAKADFAGANMAGAVFHWMVLPRFSAAGAKLAESNFVATTLHGADFRGADLTGAKFTSFNGRGADFSTAELVGADLSVTRCVGAKFVRADLTHADMYAADVRGADFTDANLTNTNLYEATFDEKTKWPAGFAIPGEAKWKGRGTDPRFTGKGKKAAANDINGLMTRLHATIDEKRMGRVLDMLKKERNQLFSEVEPALIRGIVRSQRDIDTVYSCVLTEDGTYSCCTPDLTKCMGLSDEPCKHLLVLLIGLARAGQLDPATADKWVLAADKKNPRWNKTVQNHMADSLLKYKGAVAGEIDWRPTETIPEDFYAM